MKVKKTNQKILESAYSWTHSEYNRMAQDLLLVLSFFRLEDSQSLLNVTLAQTIIQMSL